MKYKKKSHKVSIVMGSQSDYKTMKNCEKVLKILKVNYETNIVSAHRTPDRLYTYAKKAENNNISIIIAGAGGSAHLPGMIAAITRIPVIGVPIESKKLKGLDSLLSIAQMPNNSNWYNFYGVGVLTGIGFTMSLFVGNLAFVNNMEYMDGVKIGVLSGSLLSTVVGFVLLYLSSKKK